MIDPHKHDYLHAEEAGDFEEWMPRTECTCDACYLYRVIRYSQMADFVEDYKEFQKLLAKWHGDREWALDELIK